jgi:hypothetical protein
MALCELAQSIDRTINGTIDLYLHVVSNLSTALQRSQVKSNETWKLRRARDDHTAHNKKEGYSIEKPSDVSVPTSYAGPKLVLSISGRGIAY